MQGQDPNFKIIVTTVVKNKIKKVAIIEKLK